MRGKHKKKYNLIKLFREESQYNFFWLNTPREGQIDTNEMSEWYWEKERDCELYQLEGNACPTSDIM